MLREKMDLRIKCLLLPFIDVAFYKRDVFRELAKNENSSDYQKFLEKEVVKVVYPLLKRTSHIFNLDEIKLILKKYYAHDQLRLYSRGGRDISGFYLNYLARLSRFFLTHRNGKIAFKYWKGREEAELLGPYSGLNKVAMWNSLDRMFTTEILVFLYMIQNGMSDEEYLRGYHSSVYLADTQLEQVLNRGVAETHLHLNAGGNFSMNWLTLMSPENNYYNPDNDTQFFDQVIHKDTKLQPYIRALVIVRILLAYYLYQLDSGQTQTQSLCDFYRFEPDLADGVTVLDYLECIYHGHSLEESTYDFDHIYQKLKVKYGLIANDFGNVTDWRTAAAQADVIHRIINPHSDMNTVENVFLFKCLKYLVIQPNDDVFAQLFWQYVRIKNETFQVYIQANLIRGLDYFIPYCERATEDVEQGLIIHEQLQNPFLRKLEVRMTTGGKQGEGKEVIKAALAKRVRNILSVYRDNISSIRSQNRPIPELGIVLHFIKKEDEHGIDKCWLDAHPFHGVSVDKTKLYFRLKQDHYTEEMMAVRELREEVPGLAEYIVGIDAAGSEFAVEPWVFAPVFKQARDSKTHKMLYTQTGARIRNLGLTYHAGEDFRHLLGGIRRVHEVIEHFQFRAGDRIGHGMALGIDPVKWHKRNRVVILPRIEHLENLLWVWGLYKDGLGVRIDASFLEQEILTLAEQIYIHMEGITVYGLWKAYRKKFESFEVSENFTLEFEYDSKSRLFCKHIATNDIWNVERLIHAQHCKCYLYAMQEPIEIEVRQEDLHLIEQVQKVVKEQVSGEGIIIEANPTSNTAIGEIENVFQHYIQSLNQRGLHAEQSVGNGIMVTINTDDPVVFNTNINNEIAYMFFALLEKGYSRDDILKWVDKVREQGIQSSFVEMRAMSPGQRRRELDQIVAKLHQDY